MFSLRIKEFWLTRSLGQKVWLSAGLLWVLVWPLTYVASTSPYLSSVSSSSAPSVPTGVATTDGVADEIVTPNPMDEACHVMKDAVSTTSKAALDFQNGKSLSSVGQAFETATKNTDAAFKKVPTGDMYWWMVAFANSTAALADAANANDKDYWNLMVGEYLNQAEKFEQFCI